MGRCSVLWVRRSHSLFTTVKLSDQGCLAASLAFCQTLTHWIKEWIHLVCHWSCFSMPSDLSSHVLSMYQKGKMCVYRPQHVSHGLGCIRLGLHANCSTNVYPYRDFRTPSQNPFTLSFHGVFTLSFVFHTDGVFYGTHIYESDVV